MKKLLLALMLVPAIAFAGDTVTNKFLTVDQRGQLNSAGVATVESVVSNAVLAELTRAKAQAAQAASEQIDQDTSTLAANIVSNKIVVFRGAYSDGFTAMVVLTDADKLACKDFKLLSYVGNVATFQLDYVCLANITSMKPTVKVNDHCTAKSEFTTVPESDVQLDASNPHTETWTANDATYSNFYRLTFTRTLAQSPGAYFIYIIADGDMPSAAGAGMDLPNGVKGGITATLGNGWDIKFVKGIAVEQE